MSPNDLSRAYRGLLVSLRLLSRPPAAPTVRTALSRLASQVNDRLARCVAGRQVEADVDREGHMGGDTCTLPTARRTAAWSGTALPGSGANLL